MSYGDLESDAGAVAESKDVCLADLQVPQEGHDIVRGRLECDGRIAIGGTAVPLLLHGDDPTASSEDRQYSTERDLQSGPAAVKQDERNAVCATMDFVIHVDAVNRGMAARLQSRLKGRHAFSTSYGATRRAAGACQQHCQHDHKATLTQITFHLRRPMLPVSCCRKWETNRVYSLRSGKVFFRADHYWSSIWWASRS